MLLGKNSAPTAASIGGSSEAPEDDVLIRTPDTIAIPGYAQLVMNAGELLQEVELYNPEGNPSFLQELLLVDHDDRVSRVIKWLRLLSL
jgi:hypothetical protein